MEELINTFHIDGKLLIAQLVNFAIVLAIINYVIVKPLLAVVVKRTKEIEQGLADAEESKKCLDDAETRKLQILEESRRDAAEIKTKAKQNADTFISVAEEKAQKEKEVILEQGRNELAEEKKNMEKRLKIESIDLIVHSSRAILKRELENPEASRAFIQQIVIK